MTNKLLIFFSFIIVFVAGVVIASIFHTGSPMVTIDFVNSSGKKIESIEITQEFGKDEKIRHQIKGNTPGATKTFRMYAPGESSFEVKVTFSDGKQIVGGEGYIEAGNRVTEVIGAEKIESEVSLTGSYKP
jgi:hypothetical protein